jgi:hypothetical protein
MFKRGKKIDKKDNINSIQFIQKVITNVPNTKEYIMNLKPN